MNVDFQYLDAGLWGMLTELDSNEKYPEMLDFFAIILKTIGKKR